MQFFSTFMSHGAAKIILRRSQVKCTVRHLFYAPAKCNSNAACKIYSSMQLYSRKITLNQLKRPIFRHITQSPSSDTSTPITSKIKPLSWTSPKSILIIKKPNDTSTSNALKTLTSHLSTYPITLHFESPISSEMKSLFPDAKEYTGQKINLVITLGGDGTLLHASRLFPQTAPPILSFCLGTLNFLIPFEFSSYQSIIDTILKGPVPIVERMRLETNILNDVANPLIKDSSLDRLDGSHSLMNEVVVHRGTFTLTRSKQSIGCHKC